MGNEEFEQNSTVKNIRTPLPSREYVTATQIGTLLSALTVSGNLWIAATRTEDDDGVPKASQADGGVAMAAEMSVVALLNRIDKVVNDDSRWNMETQNMLEGLLARMYQENTEVLRQTSYATALASAPHTRMNPTLLKHGDLWVAAYGNPKNPESFICGTGPTPHLAMLSFDEVYLRGSKNRVEVVVDDPPISETKTKPRKKKR